MDPGAGSAGGCVTRGNEKRVPAVAVDALWGRTPVAPARGLEPLTR